MDGCTAGASRSSGVLNLAGNAMEWLDGGWLIGGGFSGDLFDVAAEYKQQVGGKWEWEADLLRDEIPGRAAFAEFDRRNDTDRKNKYDSYRVPEDDAEAQMVLEEVGLRCVLNLE